MIGFFRAVLKTVIGVGRIEDVAITPFNIILFALGVLSVFLGTITALLLLVSLFI
ncbi:hypothetical protein N9C48_00790 [bacterium]|jgi:hypothetical protein|nr:hypothetical protein [bacterium]